MLRFSTCTVAAALIVAAGLVGCGDDDGVPAADAGVRTDGMVVGGDGGSRDSGPPATDAGPVDASAATDAGDVDSGSVAIDAGDVDSGSVAADAGGPPGDGGMCAARFGLCTTATCCAGLMCVDRGPTSICIDAAFDAGVGRLDGGGSCVPVGGICVDAMCCPGETCVDRGPTSVCIPG